MLSCKCHSILCLDRWWAISECELSTTSVQSLHLYFWCILIFLTACDCVMNNQRGCTSDVVLSDSVGVLTGFTMFTGWIFLNAFWSSLLLSSTGINGWIGGNLTSGALLLVVFEQIIDGVGPSISSLVFAFLHCRENLRTLHHLMKEFLCRKHQCSQKMVYDHVKSNNFQDPTKSCSVWRVSILTVTP